MGVKFTVNSPCPCGSGNKYKKCCQTFHKGKLPQNALELMKSRYTAFKLLIPNYIIATTHPENKDFNIDTHSWSNDILDFGKTCNFLGLEILDFQDGINEAFVTFHVDINCGGNDNSFTEKSRFFNLDGKWLYHSGEFI